MKKILMAAAATLCFAGSSFAQENAGGDAASNFAFGNIDKPIIIAGAVGMGILGAVVANNRGTSTVPPGPGPGPDPDPDPDPDPTCEGSDPLVDGVCTGTTTTVTVTCTGTVTGTATMTITVPVTFTYLPTV